MSLRHRKIKKIHREIPQQPERGSRYLGQLADIDDGDVLQSRIDSIANGSLASLKEIMIQIINSVPNSNLNDHLWNGKEKFVYLEVIIIVLPNF